MIPKKIHYCWFGGSPKPELAQKCITSWEKYCPDYEIIEWNETNFDVLMNDYTREAYEAKKWAFVSDVARLYVLVTEGGIYMDTDVEVLRPLDDLLGYEAVSGFESETQIPTGLMACREGFPLFEELLKEYDAEHFLMKDGSFNYTTNVTRITAVCLKYGLRQNNTFQTIKGFSLFPRDYFCPKDLSTGRLVLTDNTYTIHHFDGSWLSEVEKETIRMRDRYTYRLSSPLATYVAKFLAFQKCEGTAAAFRECYRWAVRRIRER